MKKRFISLLASTILLTSFGFVACAEDTPAQYIAPSFETSGNPEFDAWRTDFANRAVNKFHKDSAIIENMLSGLSPNQKVTSLNDSQPEVIKPIWDYINSAVSQNRISQGRENYWLMKPVLQNTSMQYGVPLQYAIAIWGMETSYGANKGSMDVVRALATFAYTGRRKELGETELLAVADILGKNYATKDKLIGSWAGAMGHTQFMPSSYLSRAIDGDGDGIRDIWNNQTDALASTINYLKAAGWKPDEPWGREVFLLSNFDFSLADGQFHDLEFWRNNGVLMPQNVPSDWNVRLLIPAGANGPKFLVGKNYSAIRNYNASDSYALSVAFLSDEIAGIASKPEDWPYSDRPLTRTQAIELQTILSQMGFQIGEIDGLTGTKTKLALQSFQKSKNLMADGYPSLMALEDLRKAQNAASPKPIENLPPKTTQSQGNSMDLPVRLFGPKK